MLTMARLHFKSCLIFVCLVWLNVSLAQAQTITQTPQQWREDLRYLAQELPRRHPNPFHAISAEAWTQEVAALDEAIPILPDHIIIVRLTRLVALLGDVHNSLSRAGSPYLFRQYPLSLINRPDGIFVQTIASNPVSTNRGIIDNHRLTLRRVVAIGGMDIEQAKERATSLIAAENTYSATTSLAGLLVIPEVLHALGVIPDMEHGVYTLADETGQRIEKEFAPFTLTELNQMTALSWVGIRRWTPPLYNSRPNSVNYWYAYLPESRALYLRYVRCQEMANQPFASFMQELAGVASVNPTDRLILDLRFNGGGNSAILDPLIEAIRNEPSVNQRGKLFVLINNGTFSSATLNANSLQLRTNAILIGEPTGDRPNSYGEVRQFTLPNSGLTVNHATRFFRLRLQDDPPALLPDVVVPYPFLAYVAGLDPVLEAALRY